MEKNDNNDTLKIINENIIIKVGTEKKSQAKVYNILKYELL